MWVSHVAELHTILEKYSANGATAAVGSFLRTPQNYKADAVAVLQSFPQSFSANHAIVVVRAGAAATSLMRQPLTRCFLLRAALNHSKSRAHSLHWRSLSEALILS